jgi:hypothetical protein
MQIISIDVGIKNLAYCILEIDTLKKDYKIIKWDTINLCKEDLVCSNNCIKKAKYIKNDIDIKINYCQVHAKKSKLLLPTKELSSLTMPKLKKMKLEKLQELANKLNLVLTKTHDDNKTNKELLITSILNHIELNLLHPVENNNSANAMDLVSMGIALRNELDTILGISEANISETNVQQIVIENQISPIANRMKTLQGMIAQYFIMNGKHSITFASSINKLKAFIPSGEKTEYKDRKKLGIEVTKGILGNKDNQNEHQNEKKWQTIFDTHKKKDDLADSFLQGLWFIQTKHGIKENYTHAHIETENK